MLTIYHNPACSKSRETLKLIQDSNKEVNIVEYLKQPPNKKELQEVLEKLKLSPKDIIRFKENLAKEIAISPNDQKSDTQWLKILCDNPKLIERPIVFNNEKAVIGRPPENVNDLL